jgi:hypothetical protein
MKVVIFSAIKNFVFMKQPFTYFAETSCYDYHRAQCPYRIQWKRLQASHRFLRDFPKEMWQWKPAPDKWSIHEVIMHIADSEANS